MSESLSSSFGVLAASLVVLLQIVALLVLAVAVYEYRIVLASRSRFFSAMDLSEQSYGVRRRKLLVWVYACFIVAACVAVDCLFFLRPHLL